MPATHRGPVPARAVLAALALAAGLALAGVARAGGLGRLAEGERIPEIVLPGADDGSPVALTGFIGRRTLLIVFASW